MSPRPILKRAQSTDQRSHRQQQIHQHPQQQQQHQGVHFPPSPSLTRTFSAHSASAYDRSPIVVESNTCALPERGCPGRTYTLEEGAAPSPRGIAYARDYHPRALAFASTSNACGSAYPPVPSLIPDLSSESDESDGFTGLPADLSSSFYHGYSNSHNNSSSPNKGYTNSLAYTGFATSNANVYAHCDDDEDAHPTRMHKYRSSAYPASPPSMAAFGPIAEEHQSEAQPQPRRRRERRHESSRDPDRIPSSEANGLAPMPISPSPRKKGVRRTHHYSTIPPVCSSGFGVPDDGCLGGF